MLRLQMLEVVEYTDERGKNAYQEFLDTLDTKTVARVMATLARIKQGNFGDVKPVGTGVSETRIHTGPGYRLYFGRNGQKLVILLGGGTKRKQDRDITKAQACWAEYKANKKRS